MNDLPSKERTRDLLMNWRNWSRTDPKDPAQVYYYTECPMLAGTIPANGSNRAFDSDAALMVEEVMRRMFHRYPRERTLLINYYIKGYTQAELAKELGINQGSVSKYRLPAARLIFAEQWGEMVRGAA